MEATRHLNFIPENYHIHGVQNCSVNGGLNQTIYINEEIPVFDTIFE